jgi:hypothetical protein
MNVKSFLTVKNNVITGVHDGDMEADFFHTNYYGHDFIELPEGSGLPMQGDTLDFYDANWQRKTDGRLIDEGVIKMPPGYTREGETLRPMTKEEKIIAGIDLPLAGTKVSDGQIVNLTLDELHDVGLVSDDEYRAVKKNEVQSELNRRLGELNTDEAKAMAEIDDDYAAKRKEKIKALLAVKNQQGWPLAVEWPEDKAETPALPD